MNIYWTTNAKEFGGGKVQNVPYKYRLLGYVDGHLTFAIVTSMINKFDKVLPDGRQTYKAVEQVTLDMVDPDDGRWGYVDRYRCVAEAKLAAAKMDVKPCSQKRLQDPMLQAFWRNGENQEFYPTPDNLAGKMFAMLDKTIISNVLEPSAGTGSLVESFQSFAERKYDRYDDERFQMDTIEASPELRACLKGKGIHVVSDDFLPFTTMKRYDTIIMNPPFSNGDKHLLKALDLIQDGGQVVCLLNAETLRNPCTNSRKMLMQLLNEYDAQIRYVKDGFKHAARKTDVDVAIVYVHIRSAGKESEIFNRLKKAQKEKRDAAVAQGLIVAPNNWMEEMVADFELNTRAGLALIDEYFALKSQMPKDETPYSDPILKLEVGKNAADPNAFLEKMRSLYWSKLLAREELTSLMTSDMKSEYQAKISTLREYDFSIFNIQTVFQEIQAQLTTGVKDSIMKLFDTLTTKYSWLPETGKNIHYYNGWATNKAHKVGSKVIIPLNGAFAEEWSRETLDTYRIVSVISDLERALNFLDRGETAFRDPTFVQLKQANAAQQTKNVEFTYFSCNFYKKGTCHITFHKDAQRIIDRLNIFAGKEKAWLPPCYGKKTYQDMNADEKAVIDDFQGADAYNKVMVDPGLYLTDSGDMTMLPAMV